MINVENIDAQDAEILSILQRDGRESAAEIGRRVGLATSAVHERIKKLLARGVVREFTARIEPRALGYGLTALVSVRTDERLPRPAAARALAAIPEVLEVFDVAGPDCYVLKVVARDMEHLHALVRQQIGSVADVRSTSTTIVMATVKDTTQLPLARPRPGRAAARQTKQKNRRSDGSANAKE